MVRLLIASAFALALASPAALAQAPGGFGVNTGTCSNCDKVITWSGTAANAPKRCPHCHVRIGSVDNDDGTETDLNTGQTRARTPGWVKVLLVVFILVVLVVAGVVKVMADEKATRPEARAKMDRAARERRRDFEARRRPPTPPPLPEDDAPIKMADPDDDFEVVGDAPPPPAPADAVPPRRARAKLLRPDGGPQ